MDNENIPQSRKEALLENLLGADNEMQPPQSRTEAILQNMLGANNVLEPPQSREEYLLQQILEQGGTGGDITLETLNVSANGTTNAPSGTAYNKVVANVPNTYAASDEGKVVSSGALVAQTAHADVTANGTIDTTLNNSVTVNVSGYTGVTGSVTPASSTAGYKLQHNAGYSHSIGMIWIDSVTLADIPSDSRHYVLKGIFTYSASGSNTYGITYRNGGSNYRRLGVVNDQNSVTFNDNGATYLLGGYKYNWVVFDVSQLFE